MKKSIVWLLVVAMTLAIAGSAFAAETIRIGHTVSMTGARFWTNLPLATLGMPVAEGATVAEAVNR